MAALPVKMAALAVIVPLVAVSVVAVIVAALAALGRSVIVVAICKAVIVGALLRVGVVGVRVGVTPLSRNWLPLRIMRAGRRDAVRWGRSPGVDNPTSPPGSL